jgi:hypothetical protein
MGIDRSGQLKILETLAEVFPADRDTQRPDDFGLEAQHLYFQLAYLEQHSLITCTWSREMSAKKKCIRAAITAKGLDFIEEDGGLCAVLGVVTIRIHDDTLKTLIESRILESDISAPDKRRMIDQLRELPAETTKHLALKLVDKALEAGPQAIGWLESFLRNFA